MCISTRLTSALDAPALPKSSTNPTRIRNSLLRIKSVCLLSHARRGTVRSRRYAHGMPGHFSAAQTKADEEMVRSRVDGTFIVAKKRGLRVGATKRGKGTKLMVVADFNGLPLAANTASAAPHEVTLVRDTLSARFTRQRPSRSLRRYRHRWKIERLNAWLQNFRRIATRFDYHAEIYLGFVHLGCIKILLSCYL